jgi:hypothetical protein
MKYSCERDKAPNFRKVRDWDSAKIPLSATLATEDRGLLRLHGFIGGNRVCGSVSLLPSPPIRKTGGEFRGFVNPLPYTEYRPNRQYFTHF